MAGSYKHKKRGAGRFVQLPEWLMASPAWGSLKPGPRALYVELKRRYNGSNNGSIILSHRDAAKALGVNRNTVGAWFKALEERGFIRMMEAPCLGPAGIGKASVWRVTEAATPDKIPATKDFMRWQEKQKPRPKNGTPRPSERDTLCLKAVIEPATVLKFGTG